MVVLKRGGRQKGIGGVVGSSLGHVGGTAVP